MKILHVVNNYEPSIGGTQLLYKGISERCVKQYNDEVEVYTIDSLFGSHSKNFSAITPKEENINGVFVKRFSFLRIHLKPIMFINKIIAKLGINSNYLNKCIAGPISSSLQKAIYNSDADIISASPSGFTYMSYPLKRHHLKNPKPFVYQGAFHFRDSDTEHHISKETLAAIKASEYYLCNTEYEKNRLVQLGIPEEIIVITGVATDVGVFANGDRNFFRKKLNLKDDDVLVGYFGRLEKAKSIEILVNAFIEAYQKNNKLVLVLAGFKSEYAITLQTKLSTLDKKFQQRIFWQFNLQANEKVNLYHALDMFVLPSLNESFGIVFLEAWSCKKPVIGTAIGAIKSVITEGKDGLLMQPNDINSLKEKILILAENKELRNEMGINGYNKTKENFSWEAVTEKFRNTYINAIKKFNNVHRRI